MVFEQYLIIGLAITLLGAIIATIGESEFNTLLTAFGFAVIIIGLFLMMTSSVLPHKEECTCKICYEEVGNYNGIKTYLKDNDIYYYNKQDNKFVKIKEKDGTNLTYDEFIERGIR